jgi:serine/threonine-protein kinase
MGREKWGVRAAHGRERQWPIGAVLVAALGLTACTADPYIAIADWKLSTLDGDQHAIHAPQRLDDFLPKHPSTYFLDADVPLPEAFRGQMLTLTWSGIDAFATLVVDGERILPLSMTPLDRVRPARRELVFRIPEIKTGGETLHLELEIQHVDVWTARTGLPPRLAAASYGERQTRGAKYVNDALLTGTAAIFSLLALAAGISFLMDRRRRADGWFALMTFAIAAEQLGRLGVTQLVDARDLVRLFIWTNALGAFSGLRFTEAYFRLRPARLVPMAVVAIGLTSLVAWWSPFTNVQVRVVAMDVVIVLAMLQQAVRLVRLAKDVDRRLDSLCLLGAWTLPPVVAVINDQVTSRGGALAIYPVSFAYLIFIVTQGLLLLRQHARELRALNVALEDRVATLEDRNREVSRLNEELRHQIHDRSARLADALGRIGQLSATQIKTLEPGAVISDRYRIVGALGQGGMGAVYEVERMTDGEHFALKTFLKADSGNWLARLAREAQAATAIVHPNVVGVIDIDVDASGIPFLVMELVKGEPLSAQSARFGDATFAREVVRQVACGLSALHEAGIVHRDLKPANVLLELRPDASVQAKIGDFSIARLATGPSSNAQAEPQAGVLDTDGLIQLLQDETEESQATDRALTRTGLVLGTPMYMAPELARGVKDALPSSDLWSLGVVAYQVASGALPFEEPPVRWTATDGRSPAAPIDMHLLSEPLRGVVVRCLDVDPVRRPTAQEVAAALS